MNLNKKEMKNIKPFNRNISIDYVQTQPNQQIQKHIDKSDKKVSEEMIDEKED